MFEPIKVRNNWEHLEYYLGDKRIVSGDKLTIMWPNGETEEITLIGKTKYTSVHDHGHVYSVTTEELFFEKDVNGSEVTIKLVGNSDLRFQLP
jgi:FtsP/CotA-like multicopper oxidase with cupredoxin domain